MTLAYCDAVGTVVALGERVAAMSLSSNAKQDHLKRFNVSTKQGSHT